MAKKTTARSLAHAKSLGYRAEMVERWIAFNKPDNLGRSGTRRDLFNFADILALDGEQGVHLIQSCAAARWGDALTKMNQITAAREAAGEALDRGNRVSIWAWRKVKPMLKSGKRGEPRWRPRKFAVVRGDGDGLVAKEVSE